MGRRSSAGMVDIKNPNSSCCCRWSKQYSICSKSLFWRKKILHCFAHALNLAASKPLENDKNITTITKKVKNIVTFFKHSVNASDELKKLTHLKLKQSCETRWNSTYYMIQRYVEVHKHVFTIQCNTKSAPSVIVAEELEVLTELLELLKPFENATKIVSGEKYVTASKVIPIIF